MNNPWLESLIWAARSGDDAAVRGLVRYLAECLERGEVPPAALVEYFTPIFKAIAGGRSADSELNLSTQSHIARDFDIALAVWEAHYRAVDPLPLRDNKKKEGAYSTVAKQYPKAGGVDNVERIYKTKKRLVGAVMAEELEAPKEIHDRLKVNMQVAFTQLADARKK